EYEQIEIIYKIYNEAELDIVWIAAETAVNLSEALFSFISSFHEAVKINIYSTNQLFSDFLYKIGFKKIDVNNKFVYRIINPALKTEQFFMQMADSDVF
ncbi:MAG: hypothetical protein K8R79_07410, partial [Calditrichales bacterium]|nr:hypothetical protein [Calditrichales bacterium]